MNKTENRLHAFLMGRGIPINSLPKLVQISKNHLVPIMDGYKKENKSKIFYVCVCNSGHSINCGDLEWDHSMWVIRVSGNTIVFRKKPWEFNIFELPISPNIFFVVSTRTIVNQIALDRPDIIYVNNSRDRLLSKPKRNETNRKRSY